MSGDVWITGHINWVDQDVAIGTATDEADARRQLEEDITDHYGADWTDEDGPLPTVTMEGDWHLQAILNDGECVVFASPFKL